MTRTDMLEPDGALPPELTSRLYDLASAATVRSRPGPGLRNAIDRRRRRRGWAITAGATAVTVVLASTVALLADLPGRQALPAVSPAPTPPPSASQPFVTHFEALPARFDLPTAGSLAQDTSWLSGIVQQVASQQQLGKHPRSWERVLWAGDIGDHRVALVAFTTGAGPWLVTMLTAQRGAASTQMQLSGVSTLEDHDDGGHSDALATQADLLDPTSAASGGTVFVPAPSAIRVDVATQVQLGPGRHVSTQWRPLTRTGAVWTGSLSGAEMTYGGLRVLYPDGTVKGYSLPVEPVVHQTSWVASALAPVVHGVDRPDRARLVTALTTVVHYGLLPGMVVDQGRIARFANGTTLAAVTVRTPQGAHLVGACLTGTTKSPGTSCSESLVPASPPQTPLLAVVDGGSSNPGQETVLVIAPPTATHIALGTTSFPLTEGMARLAVPTGELQATATATDGAGQVVATAKVALTTGTGGTLWNDLARNNQAG